MCVTASYSLKEMQVLALRALVPFLTVRYCESSSPIYIQPSKIRDADLNRRSGGIWIERAHVNTQLESLLVAERDGFSLCFSSNAARAG